MPLRIPTVLAFTVIGAAAAGAAGSCGSRPPGPDASTCAVLCIPDGSAGSGSDPCPVPTCATGPDHDMCPAGCVPQPIA